MGTLECVRVTDTEGNPGGGGFSWRRWDFVALLGFVGICQWRVDSMEPANLCIVVAHLGGVMVSIYVLTWNDVRCDGGTILALSFEQAKE